MGRWENSCLNFTSLKRKAFYYLTDKMKPRVFIKEDLVKPEAKKSSETFWIQFMEMKKWLYEMIFQCYAWWWRIEYYRSSPLRTEYSAKIQGIHPRDVSKTDAIFCVFQESGDKWEAGAKGEARARKGYSASRTKLALRSWRASPLKRNKWPFSPRIMMSTTQH